jgi:hypothetical protein
MPTYSFLNNILAILNKYIIKKKFFFLKKNLVIHLYKVKFKQMFITLTKIN